MTDIQYLQSLLHNWTTEPDLKPIVLDLFGTEGVRALEAAVRCMGAGDAAALETLQSCAGYHVLDKRWATATNKLGTSFTFPVATTRWRITERGERLITPQQVGEVHA